MLERRKQREVKREPFIDCHLPLQAFLLFTHVLLSFILQDLQVENTKEKEEEELT